MCTGRYRKTATGKRLLMGFARHRCVNPWKDACDFQSWEASPHHLFVNTQYIVFSIQHIMLFIEYIPQTWEWFGLTCWFLLSLYVHPTNVGMIRFSRVWPGWWSSASHKRGNDSKSRSLELARVWYIPQAWEWFALYKQQSFWIRVYPTGVGMIRWQRARMKRRESPSHRCGNDSVFMIVLDPRASLISQTWEWFG